MARSTRKAAVAHIDDGAITSPDLVETVACGSESADIFIAGSYGQNQQSSLASELLHKLEEAPQVFTLQLCCTGESNTLRYGGPRCQHLFVDTLTGQAFASLQQDLRGLLPAFDHREAVGFVGGSVQLRQIYDHKRCCICVPPLSTDALSARYMAYLASWLQMDDDELLEASSTSPAHERPSYAAGKHLILSLLACIASLMVYMGRSCSLIINFLPNLLHQPAYGIKCIR